MKGIIVASAVLVASSAAAQTVVPSDAYTHPQSLVAVEGTRRLNLFCQGQGSPVVLFDSGLGGTTVDWRYVQGEIAKSTRACSYDRAGYAFSDPAPRASDVTANVDDIHRLLKAAGIAGPVIYVGHSIAGLYGVTLQATYPDDVAAEVLVDPSFANQSAAMTAGLAPAQAAALLNQQQQGVAAEQACLDLARKGALNAPQTDAAKACVTVDGAPYPLDDALKHELERRNANPDDIAANISELSSFMPDAQGASVDRSEVEAAHPAFGDKLLIILTHGTLWAFPGFTPEQSRQVDAAWRAGHDDLAKLSTRGSNTVVPDSGHYIQVDQPKAVIAAIQQAVTAVQTNPAIAMTSTELVAAGDSAADKGDGDMALKDYNAAIDKDPKSELAYLHRARYFLDAYNLDAARKDIDVVIALDPASAEAFGLRGQAELESRALDPAIADFGRAITLDPNTASLHDMRAEAYLERGDIEPALADLDAAVALDATSVDRFEMRAEAHLMHKDQAAALADFDRAVALAPQSPDPLLARAAGYDQLGYPHPALDDIDRAIALDPSNRNGYLARAQHFENLGYEDRAIAAYSDGIAHIPNDALLYDFRGHAYARNGDDDNALEDFSRAIELEPKFSGYYDDRAALYLSRDDLKRALADADAAVNSPYRDTDAYDMRARIYDAMGDVPHALADEDQAVAMDPHDAQALNARCWIRATHNIELDKALADCDQALGIIPNMPDYFDSRGLVHLRRGELDAAIDDYTKALKAEPGLATSLYGRALAEQKKGLADQAKNDFAAARAADAKIDNEFASYGLGVRPTDPADRQ